MQLKFARSRLDDAARVRRAGWADAVLAVARVDGDQIEIAAEDWHRLTLEYRAPELAQDATPRRGLGDLVHAILKPFVRGTRFESCGGCAQRKAALNKIKNPFAQEPNRDRSEV